MIEITEKENPLLIPYRDLRFTPEYHINNKLFIAEGKITVRALFESKLSIESVLVSGNVQSILQELLQIRKIPEDKILISGKDLMEDIAGFKLHQGIMAIGKIPAKSKPENMGNRIVLLNGIVNSENVGAIVRNCAAFRVNDLITDSETSSPWLRRAVRVSMGNIFRMNYTESIKAVTTLKSLVKLGYKIICAEKSDSSINLYKFDFPDRYVLILGAEGTGIKKEVLEMADYLIEIPISENVNSINVAATSAVILSYTMNRS